MTLKRRRERDKPKCPPDALYNPNKRVLLSYASDEDEDTTKQPHNATTDEQAIANYHIDEYPEDDEEDAQVGAEAPTRTEEVTDCRDDAAERQEDVGERESFQPQGSMSKKRGNRLKRNETTNQYPQLGLVSFQWEEEDEDEEYDSTTEEAMAYLRAVRSERQGIPEVLTASVQDQDGSASVRAVAQGVADTGNNDEAHDGVWVAPASQSSPAGDASDPWKVYTRSIKDRFLYQRRQLHLPPTAKAIAELDDSYPISFARGNHRAHAEWHRLMSSKAPRLAQLQSLEQETAFDLLEMLQNRILVAGKNVDKTVSNWIWSLLARLDDIGSMTNDQVYLLRELGRRAVFLQYSLTSPEIAAQLNALGQTGSTVQNQDEISLDLDDDTPDQSVSNTAQAGQASSHPTITDNTLATLDMILVVVGEVYGQLDLLEFRTPWIATEKA